MASWAPACCMCWAMAQAMLRLLATPNTTTVRPSMLIAIRSSSSASAIELTGSIFEDISLAARMSCGGCAAPASVGRRALTTQIFSFLCSETRNILPHITGAPLRGGAMATIRDLLINQTIHYVQPDQTVFEAARYMVANKVG